MATTRSHTNTSRLCKFDQSMHKFQQGQNANKPKQNMEITKVFNIACWFAGLSKAICTSKYLYSTTIFLVRLNIEIHLISHFREFCFPFLP